MKISYMVWFLFLLAVSWQDFKKKEISVKLLVLMGVIGTGIQFFEKTVSLGSWFGGIGLGLALLFLGLVTGENIGYGDGWLVLVMGMSLGFQVSLLVLLISLGISALVGGGLLIFRRVKRNYRIPFAPFLLLGCIFSFAAYGG